MNKNTGHSFCDYTAATEKHFKQMMQQRTEEEVHKLDNELFKTRLDNWIAKDYCKCSLWCKDCGVTIKFFCIDMTLAKSSCLG